jgi:site-specific DNA-methyltransferase (adenine-specific)
MKPSARTRPNLPCLQQADNLDFMRTLPDGCCDMIYIDPPFFTGKTHQQKQGDHRFDDRWPEGLSAYLAFLKPRLEEMRRLLAESGSLYVHLDWHVSHYVRVMLDEIFGLDHFINEIIWAYRTGGRSSRHFARKHDTILVYARQKGRHVFNVQREGEFRTDGMKRDEQGRPYKQTRQGRLYFHPEGPAMTDVWDIPFLSTVARERVGYPTQKPIALLERMIRASTNAGDCVADFFCGSGTTLVAAARLGRCCIGCDISKEAVALARSRLDAVGVQPGAASK